MKGLVEAVDVVPVRGFLAADVAAGSSTLLVNDGAPFAVEGARAVVVGVAKDVVTVVAGAGEDDPATVTLASPVAVAVEAGEPVGVLPLVEYTTATVVLAGGQGVVEATVDQGLQGKVDLQEGSYQGTDRPRVDVELIDGEHFIVGVDGRGADDGSYLAPGTLPPPDLTELYEQLDALAVELAAVLPITETKIADGAITTPKLVANAITASKIAAEAVTAAKLFVDEAMVNKLVAKMIEVEALNAQVITGLRIVGGSIYIAQGSGAMITQDFSTASGTTPPAGWTRQERVAGTGATIDFTSNPSFPSDGTSARFRTGSTSGGFWSLGPNGFSERNVRVMMDITTPMGGSSRSRFVLAMRESAETPEAAVRLGFSSSGLELYLGTGAGDFLQSLPSNSYRFEVILRGTLLRYRTHQGETATPWIDRTLAAPVATGAVVFGALRTTSGGATEDYYLDNVTIETIPQGLEVDPDGRTSVQYLTIGQAGTAPDPLLPTDIANKRYIDRKMRAGFFTMPAYTGNNTMRVNFDIPFPTGVKPAVTCTHEIGTGTNISRTAYAGSADNAGFTAVSVRAGGAADPAQPMQYTAIAP